MCEGLLVNGLACEELGSLYFVLTISKKLNKLKKNQQLFFTPSDSWCHREISCTKVERQTGEYKESQLTRADVDKQIHLWEPVLERGNLNRNWQIDGGSVWRVWELKTPSGPSQVMGASLL